MYPMLEYGAEVGAYFDADTGYDSYYAINEAGKEYKLSAKVFHELFAADGTHPIKLSQKTVGLLEKQGLIRTKRIIEKGPDKNIILLALGKRRSKKLRPLAAYLYAMHRILLVVMPVLACVMSLSARAETSAIHWGLFMVLFLLSVVLHEYGHMIAALNFGTVIGTLGWLLLGSWLPLGAYVDYDEEKLTKAEKVKAVLAGIETNFILACIFLVLRFFIPAAAHTLFIAAVCDGILIIENLIPAAGTDGEQFLKLIFGVKDVSKYADRVAHSKKLQKRIRKTGFSGCLKLVLLCCVRRKKMIIPAVIIVSCVLWFWAL